MVFNIVYVSRYPSSVTGCRFESRSGCGWFFAVLLRHSVDIGPRSLLVFHPVCSITCGRGARNILQLTEADGSSVRHISVGCESTV